MVRLADEFKEYLGAIEFTLDEVTYDIGLRELESGCFQGTWTCHLCDICGTSANPTDTKEAAIEMGKFHASKHHDEHHGVRSDESQSVPNCRDRTASKSRKAKSLQTSRPPCRP
jgi:hypothetical protein